MRNSAPIFSNAEAVSLDCRCSDQGDQLAERLSGLRPATRWDVTSWLPWRVGDLDSGTQWRKDSLPDHGQRGCVARPNSPRPTARCRKRMSHEKKYCAGQDHGKYSAWTSSEAPDTIKQNRFWDQLFHGLVCSLAEPPPIYQSVWTICTVEKGCDRRL
jgi:hypothetical protein